MKGQTGIGTLIVFIALVLTAAIAAFLITQTTVAAQSKAAAVADQARERTGTTVEVVRVEGLVNNGTINRYILYVRLAPGSSPINLNTTTLLYYTMNGRETFLYGGQSGNEANLPAVSDGRFYVLANYSAQKVADNILEAGELLALGVRVNSSIGPSDWWRFSIVPKEGQPTEVYGVAPDVLLGNVTVLR